MTPQNTHRTWNRKPRVIFLITAFVPAWILFGLPAFFQSADPEKTSLISLTGWSLAMWMPGLGAVLATTLGGNKPIKDLNLNRLGTIRVYFWAWLMPIVLTLLTGLVTWLLGWGQFAGALQRISMSRDTLPDVPGMTASLLAVISIAAFLTLAPLINTFFALGEELGWRGYLLPKLLPLGQIPAMIISGVIWGICMPRLFCRDSIIQVITSWE